MDTSLSDVRVLAERQQWLVTAEQARRLGVTRAQVDERVRRREWLALARGVYLIDADVYDVIPQELCWSAALMAHGPSAMLVGRTAARALGIQGLPPNDPAIEVAVVGGISRLGQTVDLPAGNGDLPGGNGELAITVRQLAVRDGDVTAVDGLRVRAARLTIVDAALQLDRVHSLCVMDSALHLQLVTPDELEDAVAAAAGRRGCRTLREMAALADGRAESPLESRVRLACIDGDLAPDDLQYEVEAAPGITVAVGDLAWLKKRRRPLLGECDGKEVHALPKPVYRDRRRGNSLTGLAHDTVRFTWTDALRPAYVQVVVRAALAADA